MFLLVGYIFMWFVSTLFLNRVRAVVEGERQAKDFLILVATLSMFWPITLPITLMSIAVYKATEKLKQYFPGKI